MCEIFRVPCARAGVRILLTLSARGVRVLLSPKSSTKRRERSSCS